LAAPPSSTTADEDIPPTFSRSDDPEAEAPQTPDTARAMLWPALGFSAGVIGLYCVFLGVLATGAGWYERDHMLFVAGMVLTGLTLFTFHRFKAHRQSQAAAAPGADPTPASERPSAVVSLVTTEYWGVMLGLFGVIALLYRPAPKIRIDEPPAPRIVRQVEKPPPPAPRPPDMPPPAQPVRTTEPPPNFRIQGLFLVGPRPSIMVNGTSLCCGDELGDVEIREIKRDSVTVVYGDVTNQRIYTWFAD